jgi:hypothetical protein
MRRLILFAVIAGTVAYLITRQARRRNEMAEENDATSEWENEGGAAPPLGI